MATLLRFATVGASGIVVNQLLLWLWVGGTGRHYLVGRWWRPRARPPGTSS